MCKLLYAELTIRIFVTNEKPYVVYFASFMGKEIMQEGEKENTTAASGFERALNGKDHHWSLIGKLNSC